jgi:hypothetical protein
VRTGAKDTVEGSPHLLSLSPPSIPRRIIGAMHRLCGIFAQRRGGEARNRSCGVLVFLSIFSQRTDACGDWRCLISFHRLRCADWRQRAGEDPVPGAKAASVPGLGLRKGLAGGAVGSCDSCSCRPAKTRSRGAIGGQTISTTCPDLSKDPLTTSLSLRTHSLSHDLTVASCPRG